MENKLQKLFDSSKRKETFWTSLIKFVLKNNDSVKSTSTNGRILETMTKQAAKYPTYRNCVTAKTSSVVQQQSTSATQSSFTGRRKRQSEQENDNNKRPRTQSTNDEQSTDNRSEDQPQVIDLREDDLDNEASQDLDMIPPEGKSEPSFLKRQSRPPREIPPQVLDNFKRAFECNFETTEDLLHLLGVLEMKSQKTKPDNEHYLVWFDLTNEKMMLHPLNETNQVKEFLDKVFLLCEPNLMVCEYHWSDQKHELAIKRLGNKILVETTQWICEVKKQGIMYQFTLCVPTQILHVREPSQVLDQEVVNWIRKKMTEMEIFQHEQPSEHLETLLGQFTTYVNQHELIHKEFQSENATVVTKLNKELEKIYSSGAKDSLEDAFRSAIAEKTMEQLQALANSTNPEAVLANLFSKNLPVSKAFFQTLKDKASCFVHFAELALYYKLYMEETLKDSSMSDKTMESVFKREFQVNSHRILSAMLTSAKAIAKISIWLTFVPLVLPELNMVDIRKFLTNLYKQKQTTGLWTLFSANYPLIAGIEEKKKTSTATITIQPTVHNSEDSENSLVEKPARRFKETYPDFMTQLQYNCKQSQLVTNVLNSKGLIKMKAIKNNSFLNELYQEISESSFIYQATMQANKMSGQSIRTYFSNEQLHDVYLKEIEPFELLSENTLQELLQYIPRELHPKKGTDLHYSTPRQFTWANWEIYIGGPGCFTGWHVDFSGQIAFNLLLHGQKTWWFVPTTAKQLWEDFLQTNKQSYEDIKNEPDYRATGLIELWNESHPTLAIRSMHQEAGDLILVPPNCWHSVSVSGVDVTVSTSANPLVWQTLPLVAAEFSKLPFHYNADLKNPRPTMPLDRIIVDSIKIFLEGIAQTSSLSAEEEATRAFLLKYLLELIKKQRPDSEPNESENQSLLNRLFAKEKGNEAYAMFCSNSDDCGKCIFSYVAICGYCLANKKKYFFCPECYDVGKTKHHNTTNCKLQVCHIYLSIGELEQLAMKLESCSVSETNNNITNNLDNQIEEDLLDIHSDEENVFRNKRMIYTMCVFCATALPKGETKLHCKKCTKAWNKLVSEFNSRITYSSEKGYAILANRAVKKNEILAFKYGGALIGENDIDGRDTTYTFQIHRGLWIDGLPKTIEDYQTCIQKGLFAWLLNQPGKQQSANVQFLVKKNTICVQALRDINPGEEFLVNYNRSSPDKKRISFKSSSIPISKSVTINDTKKNDYYDNSNDL